MLAAAVVLAASSGTALSIVDPGQGPVAIVDAAVTQPRELSGLAYDPSTGSHVAVSDDSSRLHRLAIGVDATTGFVTSAATTGATTLLQADGTPLPSGRDLEGVAVGAAGGPIYVSDEGGPRLRAHDPTTGLALAEVGPASHPALAVFASQRTNLGWESLSRAEDTGTLWLANEEALVVDGPSGQGVNVNTLVRLQRLSPALVPEAQFAYRASGDVVPGTLGNTNAGVSDLVALPGGDLLVLERTAGLVNLAPDIDLRSRIYLVSFLGATDVTGLPALSGGGFVEVGKTLLWEGVFPSHNFEGIALGPALANGDRSLLLVSDDGAGLEQSLYALRLVGVPEPGTAALLAFGLVLAACTRRSPQADA